jgi:hypothetical protein
MVTVYGFTGYSADEHEILQAKCKMPADEIEKHGGMIIDGTGEDVPESVLDKHRRFYPDA